MEKSIVLLVVVLAISLYSTGAWQEITPLLPNGVCDLPPGDAGRCKANIPMYTYYSNINKCLSFIFGGCGGQAANRFSTLEECEQECLQSVLL